MEGITKGRLKTGFQTTFSFFTSQQWFVLEWGDI